MAFITGHSTSKICEAARQRRWQAHWGRQTRNDTHAALPFTMEMTRAEGRLPTEQLSFEDGEIYAMLSHGETRGLDGRVRHDRPRERERALSQHYPQRLRHHPRHDDARCLLGLCDTRLLVSFKNGRAQLSMSPVLNHCTVVGKEKPWRECASSRRGSDERTG